MVDFDATLDLVEMDISSLKGAAYNPRKPMNDEGRNALDHSIDKFGLVQNIVVNMHEGREGTIVSGHQRVEALKRLGVTKVMVKQVDLDIMQEKKLNIAMNGIKAGWDNVKLQEMLDDFDIDDFPNMGFTDTEAQSLIAKLFEYQQDGQHKEHGHEDDAEAEDAAAAAVFTCPICGREGTEQEFRNMAAVTGIVDIDEVEDEDIP